MSRSVDYLAKSLYVTFFPYPTYYVEDRENEENEEYVEWFEVKEALIWSLRLAVYSLEEVKDKYCGETIILLSNVYCEIGVSEYLGLSSLSVRVNEDYLDNYVESEDWDKEWAESEKWIHENWPLIKSAIPYETLYKVETFSNGESVYSKTGTL